jgi:hypothetical protein
VHLIVHRRQAKLIGQRRTERRTAVLIKGNDIAIARQSTRKGGFRWWARSPTSSIAAAPSTRRCGSGGRSSFRSSLERQVVFPLASFHVDPIGGCAPERAGGAQQ